MIVEDVQAAARAAEADAAAKMGTRAGLKPVEGRDCSRSLSISSSCCFLCFLDMFSYEGALK